MNFVRWSWLDHPAHNRDLWSPVWHIPEALTCGNSVELRGFEPLTYSMRTSIPGRLFAPSWVGPARKPLVRTLILLVAGSRRKFCCVPTAYRHAPATSPATESNPVANLVDIQGRSARPEVGQRPRDRKGDEIAEFADAAMIHHRPPRHPQHGSPPAPWQKGQSALSQIRGSAQASRMRALTAHALAVRHRVPPALGDGLRTPRRLSP